MKSSASVARITEPDCRGGAAPQVRAKSQAPLRLGRNKGKLEPRLDSLLCGLKGDRNLDYLFERARNYAEIAESRLKAVGEAIDAEHVDNIALHAQAFTETSARVGNIAMMRLGISLQMLGRRGLWDAARRTFAELEQEFAAFKGNLITDWG